MLYYLLRRYLQVTLSSFFYITYASLNIISNFILLPIFSTVISPSCKSIILFTMANPKPDPSLFLDLSSL